MVAKRSVVVVGAGITGVVTAVFLSKSGHRVTLLEKGEIGGAVSGASLACITAHMIDLNEIELLRWSCQAWNDFARNSSVDIEYDLCGQIRFVEREEQLSAAIRYVDSERECGLHSAVVDRDQLSQIEPNLTSDIVAATFDPDSATVNPFLAIRAFILQAKSLGVDIRQHSPVDEVKVQNGRVAGVVSKSQMIKCDCVILATGPWTTELIRECDIDLPILPRKAQCLATVAVPPKTIRRVVSSCEASSGVEAGYTQIQQSFSSQVLFNTVLAGGLSQSGAQDSISEVDPDFVVDSIAQLLHLFPCLDGVQLLRSWVRYEAVAPDQRFLLGPLELDGLFIAAGDAGTGFLRAPAVGQLLNDMVSESEPFLRHDLYEPYRFANQSRSEQ